MAKVTVIGAGSFVFGPSVLAQAILEHRLDGIELALMDVDGETVELMARAGQRMADATGVKARVTGHTDRREALAGADFVINSAARQVFKRFEMDVEIATRHDPSHLISEFGGVAGISYSLRQIALIQEIAADIRQACPKARLLSVANPLPRVCQAASQSGVETYGFCWAAGETYARLWKLFTGQDTHYPWPAAREAWQLVMAGTNHFVWLVAMIDKKTRQDLLPQLKAKLDAGGSVGAPRSEELYRQTGYLLFPNDNHTKDFLPPNGVAQNRAVPAHGSPEERRQRLDLLRAIGEGQAPWDPLTAHSSWERPVDLIAALAYGKEASFDALNVANRGYIPQLPNGVYVEVPVKATSAGVQARPVNLPGPVVPFVASAAKVSDTIVRAAMGRSKAKLREAVEVDPTIVDKAKGWAAVQECLTAHADILPTYS